MKKDSLNHDKQYNLVFFLENSEVFSQKEKYFGAQKLICL